MPRLVGRASMISRPANTPPAATAQPIDGRLAHDDFRSDRTFQLPDRVITRDAIIRFGRRYDPQPFHIDDRAARASILKGLAASGWHSCTVYMSALQEGLLQHCADARLFAIDEIKWLFPVRPESRLEGTVRARAIEEPGPWPGSGQVELDCIATDENGRRVMTWKARMAVTGFNANGSMAAASGMTVEDIGRQPGALAYFDDVSVGDEADLGNHQFTTAAIHEFTDEFKLGAQDARPDGGSRCDADPWHIAAVSMSQLVRYYLKETASLRRQSLPVPGLGPSPGIRHVRWHHPVKPGQRLSFRAWTVQKTPISPQSNWGLLTGACAAMDENGRMVLTFEGQLLLERRPLLASD